MTRTPFLLLGDGPADPTGLGRISRDLAQQIVTDPILAERLDLVHVGGISPPVWSQWRHVPLDRSDDWGGRNVEAIYRSIWGTTPGMLFGVWDPARLFFHLRTDLPVQRWGYCAIDGANPWGGVGGPAQEALREFDRILAYGRYGSEVVKESRKVESVQWLPHGIVRETFREISAEEREAALAKLGPQAIGKTIVGAVMTNQYRKDLGILFWTIAELKRRGRKVYLWLHTDTLVKAWSVPQLVEDFRLAKQVTITGLEPVSDRELAALYQCCAITLLPSLGEGYGYPIVESLASGRPVVHTQWAGGETYVPVRDWKVPVLTTRVDGVYNLLRPVTKAEDWANAAEHALGWAEAEGATGAGYLRGSVAHLDWSSLWPRWRAWILRGLEGGR